MNKNLVTFVTVALALAIFAAIALRQETATVTNQDAGTKLFPGLMDKVNDVTQIVSQKNDQTTNIKLDSSQWQVSEKDGYPANITKVKQTILGIADFTIVEAKTKKPENYKKLQVDDKATLVTLQDASGQTLASLYLGKVVDSGFSATSKAKMYVRKKDNDQVWLVKGELHSDPMPTDWLAEDVMNIDAGRIQQVSFNQPMNGKSTTNHYAIKKQQATDKHFVMAELPKGKQLKSESAADDIAKALSNLRLMDVKKADSVAFDKDATMTTEFQTVDGLVLTASLAKQDKDTYVKFHASFDAGIRKEPEDKAPTDEASGKVAGETNKDTANPHTSHPPQTQAPAIKDVTAVQQEVAELNERLANWAFKLPENKIALLKKAQDDLLKKPAAK